MSGVSNQVDKSKLGIVQLFVLERSLPCRYARIYYCRGGRRRWNSHFMLSKCIPIQSIKQPPQDPGDNPETD